MTDEELLASLLGVEGALHILGKRQAAEVVRQGTERLAELAEEVARLQAIVDSFAARIAVQDEIIRTKLAERQVKAGNAYEMLED